ncbi:MAG: V-type ATPase subunit [Candidatus Thorarchaeota archaeon]|jgi:vacuolar-type H+-ATPase subunit C/Vma6
MGSPRAANEYAFVNARIRGLKSQFLTVGDYERLLQAHDYDEFMKLLGGTYYGQLPSRDSSMETPGPDALAILLSRDFAEVSHSLSRSLTGKAQKFTRTYLNMFLAESIKSMIRGINVGLDKEEILRFAVPISPAQAEVFSTLVDAGSVQSFIEALPYWEAKLALLTRIPAFEEFESTAPLEVAVEEWYLRSLLDALTEFGKDDNERVMAIIEPRVDLRNVLTVLRALVLQLESRIVEMSMIRFTRRSKALVEMILGSASWREVLTKLDTTKYRELANRLARTYEDNQDLAEIELMIEDYLAQRVKMQLTAFPFHLGTVIGFFSLKFYEVRNIRSIAVGVERGESAETIRRMITLW